MHNGMDRHVQVEASGAELQFMVKNGLSRAGGGKGARLHFVVENGLPYADNRNIEIIFSKEMIRIWHST